MGLQAGKTNLNKNSSDSASTYILVLVSKYTGTCVCLSVCLSVYTCLQEGRPLKNCRMEKGHRDRVTW